MNTIYVIQFDQGTTKVGCTKEPEVRVRSLMLTAAKFRIGIERHWVSTPHALAFLNEKALIRWCADHAKTTDGAEWFTGLDFETVRDYAAHLVSHDGQPPVA